LGAILFKNGTGNPDLLTKWLYERQWRDRNAILAAFTFAYQYFPALQIDILDAQLRTFEQAHAGAIEHLRHQPINAAHLVQDKLNLGLRQDNWALWRTFGAADSFDPRQFDVKHFLLQKQQRAQGLTVG
jgi:hypothetical protein